jgi:ribosomal protein L32E
MKQKFHSMPWLMSQLNFGFSPNCLFPFENIKKLKKKEEDWQLEKNRPKKVSNAWRNQAGVLDKIRSSIVSYYTQD